MLTTSAAEADDLVDFHLPSAGVSCISLCDDSRTHHIGCVRYELIKARRATAKTSGTERKCKLHRADV